MTQEAQQQQQKQFQDILFTAYNLDIDWFKDWTVSSNSIVSYIVLQGEICPTTGRKHIQGFCQLIGRKRLEQIKKFFGDNALHIDGRRGTIQQARDYCRNTPEYPKIVWRECMEFGEIRMKEQGKRTDLIRIRDELTEGKTLNECIRDCEDEKTLGTMFKYYKQLNQYQRDIRQGIEKQSIKDGYDNVLWKPWQQDIIEYSMKNTNRCIKWICDDVGKSGKSYLCKYLSVVKNAYPVTGGKVQDIYYGYDYQPIVTFDLARTYADNMDYIYNCIENFKNGYFLSTKYETRQMYFKPPQIIIFANFMPDTSKLSKDRWDIHHLVDDVLIPHNIDKELVKIKENNSNNVVVNNNSVDKSIDNSIVYKPLDSYDQDVKVRKMEQLIDKKALKKIKEPEAITYFDRYLYNVSNGMYWDKELFEYVKL